MVAPVAAEAATKDEARTRAVVAGVAAVTPTQTLKRRARMARAMAGPGHGACHNCGNLGHWAVIVSPGPRKLRPT
jgi:hypothetical protein